MAALGERLKREREARGVSLETIAAQTRIGVRLLDAIEQESFDRLPGGIFNKSFIRQYAQHLGLDEEEAVREYLLASGAGRENPAPPPQLEIALASRGPALVRIVMAAAVAVIVAGVWWAAPRFSNPANSSLPSSGPQPAPVPSSVAPPVAMTPSPEPEAIPALATSSGGALEPAGVKSEGEPTTNRTQPLGPTPAGQPAAQLALSNVLKISDGGDRPGELLLEINARSTVWLSITADGEPKWKGTLQPNQSREVQATESIRLTVGNAGGVDLTLNGKDLGALGREGEVRTVSLAARALPETIP